MKSGLKKLFNKKNKNLESEETSNPNDSYTAMSSNSLYTLPVAELVTIIFKFDQEVKSLNKELSNCKDQLQGTKSDLSKLQEESLLYKQNKETLQLECNRLAIELNEAVTSLDSKQAQLDLFRNQLSSRDELVNNYKSRITELEKQNCELQLSSVHLSAGEEIDKLRSKIEESAKQEALIHDLNLKNKTLEAELLKLSTTVAEDKEQLRMWRDKTNIFENARKEAENEAQKKRNELDELKGQITKLHFLKESSDTENRSLKESVGQKELRIQKKVAKIESLQQSNTELQQQMSVLRFENEMVKKKITEDLQSAQDRWKIEKQGMEVEFQLKTMKINEELSGLKENSKKGEEAENKLKAVQNENISLSLQLTNTLTELHEKQKKFEEAREDLAKAKEDLEKSNNKRQLAKEEILKLNQKLEFLQKAATHTEPAKLSRVTTPEEISTLNMLKPQFDALYKSLIGLIFEADKEFYKVKIGDFTTFEKKMNNLVMLLHEQISEAFIEKPANLSVPQQMAKIIKGRAPIKLFSCIADQDEPPPRLIPKPIRAAQQPVDSRMILRRGSANP